MFVQCPFCQTKLSVSPDSVPEMGKEKRCVNCMNRFRIVRTDDELVVQYQAPETRGARAVDTDRSERSLHGNLTGVGGGAVQEKRYSIHEAARDEDSLDAGGSGVFADFLNINEAPPGSSGAAGPDEEIPIEQSLRIDQVFGELSSDALSPADTTRTPPKILTSKDLLDRQERGFRRDFRVQPPRAKRRVLETDAVLGTVRDFFSNLTPLDTVLVAAFVIVGFGALLGFTSAGFFGMNWIAGDTATPQAKQKQKPHGRFTKDEVYNLINLMPDKKEARPATRFDKDGTILPAGDYSNLFVEDIEIAIRSAPSGATVYRGEQALGATPLLVRMGKTEQAVVLRLEKEGFEPETLRFVGAESRSFDLALRVLGSSGPRVPRAPSGPATKPGAPKEGGKEGGPEKKGDDFIIY